MSSQSNPNCLKMKPEFAAYGLGRKGRGRYTGWSDGAVRKHQWNRKRCYGKMPKYKNKMRRKINYGASLISSIVSAY